MKKKKKICCSVTHVSTTRLFYSYVTYVTLEFTPTTNISNNKAEQLLGWGVRMKCGLFSISTLVAIGRIKILRLH